MHTQNTQNTEHNTQNVEHVVRPNRNKNGPRRTGLCGLGQGASVGPENRWPTEDGPEWVTAAEATALPWDKDHEEPDTILLGAPSRTIPCS